MAKISTLLIGKGTYKVLKELPNDSLVKRLEFTSRLTDTFEEMIKIFHYLCTFVLAVLVINPLTVCFYTPQNNLRTTKCKFP